MRAQLPLFPEQASSVAGHVDALFFFILGVTGFFTILIAVLVIYFAIKYRRRSEAEVPRPTVGSTKLETAWSVIPLGIALFIFGWGASVYFELVRPADDAIEIYVVGKQWMWKLQHPDGQREINELHVPLGQPVKLTMISEDVIHSFFVPAFRIKADVLPGRYTTAWFTATQLGRHHLFCAEYCGSQHSGMIGSVVVMEPAEFQSWLDSRAEGSPALEGRKLFLKLQCVTCHAADALSRAPTLEALYGRAVPLRDGSKIIADEAYLRESIVRPAAKIVAGYEPIMPTYQGQVTEEQLLQLIAFIKALQPGQTPPRIEESAPPMVQPNTSTPEKQKP
jgi:cytochrome c oxidase subunit 2